MNSTRPQPFNDILPGIRPNESLISYVIRERREKRQRKARARLIRQLTLITITPLLLAGIVGMVAALVTPLLP